MVDKYFKGDYHYDNGNYEQAILWYDDINDSRAWFRKGLCYEHLKDYNKAIECFDKIRKSDNFYHKAKIEKNKCLSKLNNKPKSKNKPKSAPSNTNTNINLYFQGDYHYDNGNYEQAILWYDDVTNQYPYDGKAWFRKGLCYENLKDFNKAIECFSKIPDNDKYYHKAKIEKNKCLSKLNNKPKSSSSNTSINKDNILKYNRCPNCDAPVDLEDNFCQNCGYNLQEQKNILSELKESVDRIVGLSTLFDSDPQFNDKTEFPLISDCKSKNITLSSAFIDDLFTYLCYLGAADNIIANEEVELINFIFESPWTKQDIENLLSMKLREDITQNLPLSFMILYESDLHMKNTNTSDFEFAESLFLTYQLLGQLFISIDNEVTQDEINSFNHYMNRLRENLDNFKQFGYKYIVNSMISETPINQNTNQNSVKHNFCPSCGAKVEDKYKFCIKCGAPIK